MTIFDRQSNMKRQLKQDEYRVTMDDLNNQRLNFMAPLKDILSYYPESLPIYYEMFGTNGTASIDEKVLASINPAKRQMVEQTIALTIFQIVENFLSVSTLTSPKVLTEWMSRLVVWFQSPTLQAQYERQIPMFSDDAISFIDNIIVQSNKMKEAIKNGETLTVPLVRQYASRIEFTPRTKYQQQDDDNE